MKLMINAYGGAENFNLATFAKELPDDLRVDYRYSGPGTFWTDTNQKMLDMAGKKILAQPEQSPKDNDK